MTVLRVRNSGGFVTRDELQARFDEVESELIRYPALDPQGFRKKLEAFLQSEAVR